MKQVTVLTVAVLVVAGAVWFYGTQAEDGNPTATVGAAAPSFSLEDQTGKKVGLSDFTGKKIVVLEWINPDCPYVQRHYKAGTMKSLAEKYKDKDVVWLAVNTTHYMNKDTNQKWIADNQLPYQILDDHEGTVGRLYGAKTTPHMFIIDKSGKLVYQGAIDDDPRGNKAEEKVNYVAKALDELLAGKPISMSETKPYGCSMKYAK